MLCFSKVVTESHINWGWKRPLEFTWSNLLLRQGHQDPVVAQDHVQKASEYLPDTTFTSCICGSVFTRKLDLSAATLPPIWYHQVYGPLFIFSCIFLWLQILCNSICKGEYFCSFISQVNTDRRSKYRCTEPSLQTTAHSYVDSFMNPPSLSKCSECILAPIPQNICLGFTVKKKEKQKTCLVWFLVTHCSYPEKLYWPIESSEAAAALLFNRLQLLTQRNLWSSLTSTVLRCL